MAARRGGAMVITCFSSLAAIVILILGLAIVHGVPTGADLMCGAPEPLFVAGFTAIASFVAFFLVRRMPLIPPSPARPIALAAGALDSAANVLFWLATQQSALALTSALVSLAPATTVLLARFLL